MVNRINSEQAPVLYSEPSDNRSASTSPIISAGKEEVVDTIAQHTVSDLTPHRRRLLSIRERLANKTQKKGSSLSCPEIQIEVTKLIIQNKKMRANDLCKKLVDARSTKRFKTKSTAKFDIAVARTGSADLCAHYALFLSPMTSPTHYFLEVLDRLSSDSRIHMTLQRIQCILEQKNKFWLLEGLHDAILTKEDILLSSHYLSALPEQAQQTFAMQWASDALNKHTFVRTMHNLAEIDLTKTLFYTTCNALSLACYQLKCKKEIRKMASECIEIFRSADSWPNRMSPPTYCPTSPLDSPIESNQEHFFNFCEAMQECFKHICEEELSPSMIKLLRARAKAIKSRDPGYEVQDACHMFINICLGNELDSLIESCDKKKEQQILRHFLKSIRMFEYFISDNHFNIPEEDTFEWQAFEIWSKLCLWPGSDLVSTIEYEFTLLLKKTLVRE